MIIGNRDFDFENHFYIMGILNVTPDSFSDGGKHDSIEKALLKVAELVGDGADIIDIGGESTRPDYVRITPEEEIARVCPVIEEVKKSFDVVISLDTYKSDVALAGIASGADMINDIWGLKWDGTMAEVIAKHDVPCCLTHNRRDTDYQDFMEDLVRDLNESIELALKAGVEKEKLMIDPGIGFSKNLQQNLQVLKNLDMLKQFGCPVVLGASRKSVIGLTLGLPAGEREEGTMATSVMGLQAGCSVFRVHDVKANLRALRMAEAIIKA